MAMSGRFDRFDSFGPGPLWSGGPTPGNFHSFPGLQNVPGMEAHQRTLTPIVTGSSVLGLEFKGGVAIAADMLGSYGSLARYRNCPRLLKVNDTTVIGAAGDYADFQYLSNVIQQQVIDEECLNDGFGYTPKSLHCWLTRVMYNRRSQFNPLWNTYIVAGLEDNKPYLGYVDKIGMAYEAPSLACGFGSYLALPLIRDAMDKKGELSQEDAVELIDRCMKLLFYRDARALNKYQLMIITKDGVNLRSPVVSETNWEIAHMIKNEIADCLAAAAVIKYGLPMDHADIANNLRDIGHGDDLGNCESPLLLRLRELGGKLAWPKLSRLLVVRESFMKPHRTGSINSLRGYE